MRNNRKNSLTKRVGSLIRALLCCVALMALSASKVSAQSYVGIRGGYGIGSVRLLPAEETKSVLGLLSGGVTYKYFSDTRFVGAIEVDVQYFERAYKYDIAKDSDTSYMRSINSIDLPLMWHPHIYIMNRNGRVFFNLGLNFTYNIDSYYKWESKTTGILEEGDYDFLTVRDNRWGYGLIGGVGVSIFYQRFEFTAEGRYYYGYSDILKSYNKYPDNPMRSPLDNINISLGVSYRLGEGGIKALPSKRMAEKLFMREQALISLPTEE